MKPYRRLLLVTAAVLLALAAGGWNRTWMRQWGAVVRLAGAPAEDWSVYRKGDVLLVWPDRQSPAYLLDLRARTVEVPNRHGIYAVGVLAVSLRAEPPAAPAGKTDVAPDAHFSEKRVAFRSVAGDVTIEW